MCIRDSIQTVWRLRSSVFMVKTSQNRNSVKIILDFTGILRLLGNNSVIPFLTAAEKRHFYPPKLPALRAEVDGLAQKSVRPFSCYNSSIGKTRIKMQTFRIIAKNPSHENAASKLVLAAVRFLSLRYLFALSSIRLRRMRRLFFPSFLCRYQRADAR